MVDAGLICITSFISPFANRMARNLMEDNEFIEVFVDTPEVCEKRDEPLCKGE